jgi:hypothetical protein
MASNKTTARIIQEYVDEKFSGERANKRPDLFLASNVFGHYLLVEFKRPSHVLTRDDENQAEKYRDDLTPKFGRIEIILLGHSQDQRISSHYDREGIKLLSYASLVSNARYQLGWLLKELS